jgi:predicted phage terminase large subunit-like protein
MDPELFAPDAGKTYYFFPELFNADSAKRIRQKQGQMMFSMLYLNNPKDASLTEFKKEDFRFCEWSSTGNILFVNEEGHREEAILENLFRVMFWDPALSEEKQKKGCRNAIVVAMYDKKSHNLFFVEGFAVKNEPTSLCNRFIGFHQRYVISVAAVEDVGFQRTLLYPLRHQMFEMGNSFPVKLVPQVRSKDMRIRSLIPYFESHKVFINRRATDLIDEFEGYPMFPTKDLVDAAASCLELVHGTASQSQSIDEHTLARLRRQERDRMSQRNATTGY